MQQIQKYQSYINQATDPNSVSDFALTSKLATAPDDVNKTVSQENQDLCSILQTGSTITISTPLNDLNEFASTDVEQGSAKWVGILIGTGLPSIIGVKYGSYAFSSSDVAEAISVGGSAGEFVLWIKAEAVVTTPKTFTLYDSTGNYIYANVTVNVVDTSEE